MPSVPTDFSFPKGADGQVLRARQERGHRPGRGLGPVRRDEGEAERGRQGAGAGGGRGLGPGPLLQVQAQGDAHRDEVSACKVQCTEFPIPSCREVFRNSFREFPRLVGRYCS